MPMPALEDRMITRESRTDSRGVSHAFSVRLVQSAGRDLCLLELCAPPGSETVGMLCRALIKHRVRIVVNLMYPDSKGDFLHRLYLCDCNGTPLGLRRRLEIEGIAQASISRAPPE